MQSYTLPLVRKTMLTHTVTEFVFPKPPPSFSFQSGQYMDMTIPALPHNPDGNTRSFTIASSPFDTDLVFTIKRGTTLFKQGLFALPIGTPLSFSSPQGGFFLRDKDKNTPLVFLAGGVGITPFYSMLRTRLHETNAHDILLLAFFSAPNDFLYHTQLQSIQKKVERFSFSYHATQGSRASSFSPSLLTSFFSDITTPTYFLAGPQGFIERSITLLLSLGVAVSQIKTDIFTGYEADALSLPIYPQ